MYVSSLALFIYLLSPCRLSHISLFSYFYLIFLSFIYLFYLLFSFLTLLVFIVIHLSLVVYSVSSSSYFIAVSHCSCIYCYLPVPSFIPSPPLPPFLQFLLYLSSPFHFYLLFFVLLFFHLFFHFFFLHILFLFYCDLHIFISFLFFYFLYSLYCLSCSIALASSSSSPSSSFPSISCYIIFFLCILSHFIPFC